MMKVFIANKNWHDKNFEIRRPRDPSHKRKWAGVK